jgi:hypothetical protein
VRLRLPGMFNKKAVRNRTKTPHSADSVRNDVFLARPLDNADGHGRESELERALPGDLGSKFPDLARIGRMGEQVGCGGGP